MEKTYLMVKPDGVRRGLVGEIISRFEKKGFKLVGMKLLQLSEEMAHKHYAEHVGKPFFAGLIKFITSGPVVAMAWQGENVINIARAMMGATDPAKALPGTVRGIYALNVEHNVIHGSDSPESANRELALYFKDDEILSC